MATAQEMNGLGGGKQLLKANGAVSMQNVFKTRMVIFGAGGHTALAPFTVEKLLSRSFAADTTAVAVEDVMIGHIIEKLADIAVVSRHGGVALVAARCDGLRLRWRAGLRLHALHADHLVDLVPVDFVGLRLIVAQATRKEFRATRATN